MSAAKFEKAVSIVQNFPKGGANQPNQEEQLFFYKYFKQASVGDVNTERPGLLDFVGKAKWDAWKSVEGTSNEEAMKIYVDKLIEVLERMGTDNAKAQIKEINEA